MAIGNYRREAEGFKAERGRLEGLVRRLEGEVKKMAERLAQGQK